MLIFLRGTISDPSRICDVTYYSSFPVPFVVIFTCQYFATNISYIGILINLHPDGGGIARWLQNRR